MRFVFTTTTKVMPLIVPTVKLLLGDFTLSEVIYPEFSKKPFAIGPFAKLCQ